MALNEYTHVAGPITTEERQGCADTFGMALHAGKFQVKLNPLSRFREHTTLPHFASSNPRNVGRVSKVG